MENDYYYFLFPLIVPWSDSYKNIYPPVCDTFV